MECHINKVKQVSNFCFLLVFRALPFLLLNYALTSSQLIRIISQFKAVLFPNGFPAPPPPEPSPEEQIIIKEQLELKLLMALPGTNFFPSRLLIPHI